MKKRLAYVTLFLFERQVFSNHKHRKRFVRAQRNFNCQRMEEAKMKIAIMGFGTVGSGAYESALAEGGIEVVKILDRCVRKGYEHLTDRFT